MENIVTIKMKKMISSSVLMTENQHLLIAGRSAFGQNVFQIHISGNFSILKLWLCTLAIQF